MDIRITTTDARIGIETIPARLERKSNPARMEIKQKQALLEIETVNPSIKIEQDEAIARAGRKNNLDLAVEIAKKDKQVMEYIAKRHH